MSRNRQPGRMKDEYGKKPGNPGEKPSFAAFGLTFCILMVIWVLLSGRFDLFHLAMGAFSCFLVARFSSDHLFPQPDIRRLPGIWFRFVLYVPWLIYQIFLANIHVMYLVFHPRMKELIDPQIIRFKGRLSSDMALVTLANSITLTPGTITVYISALGDMTIHVIDPPSKDAVPEMERRIGAIFHE